MKLVCLLLVVTLSMVGFAFAGQAQTEKPCIALSPESTSPTNDLAKSPLEAAVMTSGDFEFFPSRHDGCWNVHVISLPVANAKGKIIGYALSHTVTDPQNVEVGHALTFGPGQEIFMQAMRKATADAIRNIRVAHANSQSSAAPEMH